VLSGRSNRNQTVAHVLETLAPITTRRSPVTRFSSVTRHSRTGPDRSKPGLPDGLLFRCKCPLGDTPSSSSTRRRTSFLFRLAALTSITVSSPIWQPASMHSSPSIRPTYEDLPTHQCPGSPAFTTISVLLAKCTPSVYRISPSHYTGCRQM
jgi:hypothetical protein